VFLASNLADAAGVSGAVVEGMGVVKRHEQWDEEVEKWQEV
jgi:hypothetical protein